MTPFQGKWICTPDFADLIPRNVYHKEHFPALFKETPDDPKNIYVLFKRNFNIKKTDGRYVLRVSADDYGKYYLNGKFIGQGPTPGYIESYHYNEFDVTDHLHDGENEFTAHVYYQGLNNRVWISNDLRMGLIADLYSPDGEAILSTDESWLYTELKNYSTTGFYGERVQFVENYDSRVPVSDFKNVSFKAHDDITFADAPTRPVSVYEIDPVATESLSDGAIFCDFGTEKTATVRIVAEDKSGDEIRILCGEESDDSPYKVRYMMRCNCRYDETWTLADGENTLDQFDYKAFRYLSLVPSSKDVKIKSVKAVVRHMAFDDNAWTIEADDKVLEAVFNLCKTGIKYGSQEVFVDCPSREKGQYAGDMTVTSGAHLWLTGDVYMLEKGILDHARSTKICKGLMAVLSGALMQEIADYSLQFPLLLLRHYQFTGDREGSDHASLHSNMLAPFYGFVPEGYEEKIADHLMNKGMVCGVYMSYFLMRGLCRLGKYEYVYGLITSTGENSWYNMVRDGATACIEAWGKDKKDNTSFCHPWASAPITVLIEDLLSVSYDGTVGEHHIPESAGHIKMTIPTSKGTVNVDI